MNLKKEIEAFCDENNVCFSGRHFGNALDNCTQPVVISCRKGVFKFFLVGGGTFQNVCEGQQCFAPLCPSHSSCKLGVGTGGFLVAC